MIDDLRYLPLFDGARYNEPPPVIHTTRHGRVSVLSCLQVILEYFRVRLENSASQDYQLHQTALRKSSPSLLIPNTNNTHEETIATL